VLLCAVIVESTYGVSLHGPREVRERTFIDKVVNTVKNGGRVLIPIVAIGRAQVGGVRADVQCCCWGRL
jgi:Cft2 family RNA processing exonuclease